MINLSTEQLQDLLYKAMCVGAADMKEAQPASWVESSTFFRDLVIKSNALAEQVADGRHQHTIDLERVASVI